MIYAIVTRTAMPLIHSCARSVVRVEHTIDEQFFNVIDKWLKKWIERIWMSAWQQITRYKATHTPRQSCIDLILTC